MNGCIEEGLEGNVVSEPFRGDIERPRDLTFKVIK